MNEASDFEEMLMWTSYRYCIGRTTSVSCMAYDIGMNYYDRLSDEIKQFTSEDVRREIGDRLRYILPFNLTIYRLYEKNPYDPIGVLMKFMDKMGIESFGDLVNYSKVIYDVDNDKFEFDKCNPTIKSYSDLNGIQNLIVWENYLASLFDIENHKTLTLTNGDTVEAFPIWSRKMEEISEGVFQYKKYGWEKKWVPVDEYVRKKRKYVVIDEKSISGNSKSGL